MNEEIMKQSCALISLVANAVATNTIDEAIDYLENIKGFTKLTEHAINVLLKIQETN